MKNLKLFFLVAALLIWRPAARQRLRPPWTPGRSGRGAGR